MSWRGMSLPANVAARVVIGAVAVAVATWLLLPADSDGAWIVIGMFLIGMASGAVMRWSWSPLLVPVVLLATFEGRHRVDCPDCPTGDGSPWFVGMIFAVGIALIPALGAAIGGGIVGLIDDFRG